MITLRLPAIVAVLALTSCAAPAPESAAVDTAAVKSAVEAREKEWSAAFLSANAAAVAALYTEDAATIEPSGDPRRGRDAVAKGMQPQFDSTTFTAREDVTEEVIPIGANYIFEVGRYSSTGTSKADGTPRTASGRYVVLWRKDADGVWRIHRDMGADAPVRP